MSTFLSRLVGRSLGTPFRSYEAIQPRVPSIFEPYRRVGGPLWTENDFSARQTTAAADEEMGAEQNPKEERGHRTEVIDENGRPAEFRLRETPRPSRQEIQHADEAERPRPLQSVRPMRVSTDRERTEFVESESPPSRSPQPELRSRASVAPRAQAEGAESVEEANPTQSGSREAAPADSPIRRVLAREAEPSRGGIASEPAPGSSPMTAITPSSSSVIQPSSVAVSGLNTVTAYMASAATSSAATEIRPAESPTGTVWRQSGTGELRVPALTKVSVEIPSDSPSTFSPASIPAPLILPAIPSTAVPTMMRQVPSAIPSQSPERVDPAHIRAPAHHAANSELTISRSMVSTPMISGPLISKPITSETTISEPTTRVTIGRVEVRAVFPAPQPRPVPSARPKATLSLDNYLKRDRGRQ